MNTEEQAKGLWCPMSRVAMPVNQVANRVSAAMLRISEGRDLEYFREQAENCNCIASQCAMWRWFTTPLQQFINAGNAAAQTAEESSGTYLGTEPPAGWEFVPCGDDFARWVEPEDQQLARRTGYCGIGGKPW